MLPSSDGTLSDVSSPLPLCDLPPIGIELGDRFQIDARRFGQTNETDLTIFALRRYYRDARKKRDKIRATFLLLCQVMTTLDDLNVHVGLFISFLWILHVRYGKLLLRPLGSEKSVAAEQLGF